MTTTCQAWCETQHPAWDDEPDGHGGPSFGNIGVGMGGVDPLSVFTDDPQELTPNQAREVACNLYRAAAWVEDHRDD
jgi:hypothetical protein